MILWFPLTVIILLATCAGLFQAKKIYDARFRRYNNNKQFQEEMQEEFADYDQVQPQEQFEPVPSQHSDRRSMDRPLDQTQYNEAEDPMPVVDPPAPVVVQETPQRNIFDGAAPLTVAAPSPVVTAPGAAYAAPTSSVYAAPTYAAPTTMPTTLSYSGVQPRVGSMTVGGGVLQSVTTAPTTTSMQVGGMATQVPYGAYGAYGQPAITSMRVG
jgi:hypothetical protein